MFKHIKPSVIPAQAGISPQADSVKLRGIVDDGIISCACRRRGAAGVALFTGASDAAMPMEQEEGANSFDD